MDHSRTLSSGDENEEAEAAEMLQRLEKSAMQEKAVSSNDTSAIAEASFASTSGAVASSDAATAGDPNDACDDEASAANVAAEADDRDESLLTPAEPALTRRRG